jgi:hypothetical protein
VKTNEEKERDEELEQELERSSQRNEEGPNDEHSEPARAPHTNGPRDVPRCGALSLLQKPLHHMGIQKKYCPAFV